MVDIEKFLSEEAGVIAERIKNATSTSQNEAELRSKIYEIIDEVSKKIEINLPIREEYMLINGRADAVYNRLVIEYEPPKSLRLSNDYRTNKHAIEQVKNYIDGLIRRERHKPERIAGVVLDGSYFIFVRKKDDTWHVDDPLEVNEYTINIFIKLLASLSRELALIPENLTRDFGEDSTVSRKVVSALFNALISSSTPKVNTLFEQWKLQFSEVSNYEEASKLKLETYARKFGINTKDVKPFPFFFCLHTYYALFIKLLAIQIANYYLKPKNGTNLKVALNFDENELRKYLIDIEDGITFREMGINNFIEGDFFSWYLDVWNSNIYKSVKDLIGELSNYSLVTLDVDPDTTRDLLKKLYQNLMPRELRHNLGEYYTPDWLAERLLNMLDGGEFKGDPNKRILDPACGSGTFLVLAIKKMREYGLRNKIPARQLLEKILSNVVGFDLNPLAVISARTNYLLALGDLLQSRKGEINIPVYLCDSILTPQEEELSFGGLFTKRALRFNTSVGPFAVPKSLVQAQYIDILSNFLEEAVKLNLDKSQFIEKLCEKLPLSLKQDKDDIEIVYELLYKKLLDLEKQGINGIWARIIKNAFAPLFAGEFDFVAGNPPWINWESLPEGYREETKGLWVKYGLFPHGGMDTILGKGKKDISMLMTYVSIDKYLRKGGKLGFLITQSVFKTAGSGQGFRAFKYNSGNREEFIQVLHADDMVELNPFEGASNRTSVVILQKGRPTKYPMSSYLYWKKTVSGKSIPLEASLDEVLQMTERKQFVAEPVNENDPTSPWITGRPKALKAVRKILGKSDYKAYAGVCTWANSIYWVDIIDKRPDGLVIISNITEGAKRKVESIQAAIEPDLLYPLLRGRDVKKWDAEPSAWIIITHTPETSWQAIPIEEMKIKYPKTYLYFRRFEELLKNRSGYKLLREGHPFYILMDIHTYTFAPYKVVWTRVAKVEAAVVSAKEEKSLIPQETISLVPLENEKEAYYLVGMINSSSFQYAAISYSQEGGKSMGSPHLLENINIPKFDPNNPLHLKLSELSEEAHRLAKADDQDKLRQIEEEIDQVSAQIWGLTKEELKEIKLSLEDLL